MNLHEGINPKKLKILIGQAYTEIFQPLVERWQDISLEDAREALRKFNTKNRLNGRYSLSPSDIVTATFDLHKNSINFPYNIPAMLAMAKLAIADLKDDMDPDAQDFSSGLQKLVRVIESQLN